MIIFEIILFSIVLSVDSFTAALAMGTKSFTRSLALRFAFTSGMAEGFVAFLGAVTGKEIVSKFSAIDHWVAFGLLALVAGHMIYEGREANLEKVSDSESNSKPAQAAGWFKILVVSFATSLDAFGVGIGLGTAQKPIALYSLSIGLFAFLATLLGLALGQRLSKKFGVWMHYVGGVLLFLLAFKMLEI